MDQIEQKPLGVIDALSAGFELVVRRPWVMILPVALDLFLWAGPQLSAHGIFLQAARSLNAAALQGAPPEALQNLDAFRTALQTLGERFNVFSLLALFAVGMPTLVGLDTSPSPASQPATWLAIGDGAALLGTTALFALTGLFLSSLYLEGVARFVRKETSGDRAFPPRVVKEYLSILALGVLAVIGTLLIMLPFSIGAALVGFLNQGLGSFFVITGLMILLWAGLYLAFAVPAVFVSGSGVLQAIVNSIAVFRYNFWSAMGLILLAYLLQLGFGVIWQALLGNPWGVLVDVVANAFLGTGLAAAGMFFYYDRFTWLTQVRDRIRRQQRPLLKG